MKVQETGSEVFHSLGSNTNCFLGHSWQQIQQSQCHDLLPMSPCYSVKLTLKKQLSGHNLARTPKGPFISYGGRRKIKAWKKNWDLHLQNDWLRHPFYYRLRINLVLCISFEELSKCLRTCHSFSAIQKSGATLWAVSSIQPSVLGLQYAEATGLIPGAMFSGDLNPTQGWQICSFSCSFVWQEIRVFGPTDGHY